MIPSKNYKWKNMSSHCSTAALFLTFMADAMLLWWGHTLLQSLFVLNMSGETILSHCRGKVWLWSGLEKERKGLLQAALTTTTNTFLRGYSGVRHRGGTQQPKQTKC